MASMIKYYEITKGELEKKAYEEGKDFYITRGIINK